MDPAFSLCISLYGKCSCILADRNPCDAMLDMSDNGRSADDERHRIESERADAEFEAMYASPAP